MGMHWFLPHWHFMQTLVISQRSLCWQAEASGSQSKVCECVCWAHRPVFSFPWLAFTVAVTLNSHPLLCSFQNSILPSLNEVKTGTPLPLYHDAAFDARMFPRTTSTIALMASPSSLRLQLKWDAARCRPCSLRRQLPVWDLLCLQTWRRPRPGRSAWGGLLGFTGDAITVKCNVCHQLPVFIPALQFQLWQTQGLGVRMHYSKCVFAFLLLLNFYKHTLDICLKLFLVGWDHSKGLGLRYVYPPEGGISDFSFFQLLIFRCPLFQGKEWFAGDCNRKTAETLLLRVNKVYDIFNFEQKVEGTDDVFPLIPSFNFAWISSTFWFYLFFLVGRRFSHQTQFIPEQPAAVHPGCAIQGEGLQHSDSLPRGAPRIRSGKRREDERRGEKRVGVAGRKDGET